MPFEDIDNLLEQVLLDRGGSTLGNLKEEHTREITSASQVNCGAITTKTIPWLDGYLKKINTDILYDRDTFSIYPL